MIIIGIAALCVARRYTTALAARSQPPYDAARDSQPSEILMIKLLKKMFGGSGDSAAATPAAEAVEYKQFSIQPAPIKEGGQYRTAGTIIFNQDGEARQSKFIRADNHSTLEAATEHAVTKAKQIIDERGESLLQNEHC
ncbi:MAG: HlyU family transcriptional regulator [Pseudomonadota bacterium]